MLGTVRNDTERWCPEDVEFYAGVSGWNACAGGFNRGRGRGHGDSIVALQSGLVRVSRLAAHCAPLRREHFCSLLYLRLPISFRESRAKLAKTGRSVHTFSRTLLQFFAQLSITRTTLTERRLRMSRTCSRIRECSLIIFSRQDKRLSDCHMTRGEFLRLC